jgi:alanine racemase
MGMIVVDITSLRESSVEVGEEVTLIGEDGGERISVDEVAQLSGTISYEVLTRLSPRLPRVWL